MKQVIIASIIITLTHTATFAGFKDVLEPSMETSRFLMTPITVEFAEVTSSDGLASDEFGSSIAIDGDTVIIGAPFNDDPVPDSNSGAAYVFRRSGIIWTEEAKLISSDPFVQDNFGSSVAIDGDTVVVGAEGKNSSTGALYVFTRSGTTWTQEAKLVNSLTGFGSNFGCSVAISGNTVVGGAELGNRVDDKGSAYVFTRSGTSWTAGAELRASGRATNDFFGSSIAMDGDTIIVGSPMDDDSFSSSGSAHIFTRSGTSWTQQAKLVASDPELNNRFGYSVAIDGDSVAIGSPFSVIATGAAYVFTRSGTSWTQQAKLTASDAGERATVGLSVSLDGDSLAVGAPHMDNGISDPGAAYVFTRSGTSWTEVRKILASNGALDDELGVAVAISGTTFIAGADLRDVAAFRFANRTSKRSSNLAGANQGVAYFFNLLDPTAAGVNISGRVLSPNGRAIPRATVQMIDQTGYIKTTMTNMFGNYSFENVEVGQTIMFNVYNKRYQFETQVVNLGDSMTGLNFIAK